MFGKLKNKTRREREKDKDKERAVDVGLQPNRHTQRTFSANDLSQAQQPSGHGDLRRGTVASPSGSASLPFPGIPLRDVDLCAAAETDTSPPPSPSASSKHRTKRKGNKIKALMSSPRRNTQADQRDREEQEQEQEQEQEKEHAKEQAKEQEKEKEKEKEQEQEQEQEWRRKKKNEDTSDERWRTRSAKEKHRPKPATIGRSGDRTLHPRPQLRRTSRGLLGSSSTGELSVLDPHERQASDSITTESEDSLDDGYDDTDDEEDDESGQRTDAPFPGVRLKTASQHQLLRRYNSSQSALSPGDRRGIGAHDLPRSSSASASTGDTSSQAGRLLRRVPRKPLPRLPPRAVDIRDLPVSLLCRTFSFLNREDLCQAAVVCRLWYLLIRDHLNAGRPIRRSDLDSLTELIVLYGSTQQTLASEIESRYQDLFLVSLLPLDEYKNDFSVLLSVLSDGAPHSVFSRLHVILCETPPQPHFLSCADLPSSSTSRLYEFLLYTANTRQLTAGSCTPVLSEPSPPQSGLFRWSAQSEDPPQLVYYPPILWNLPLWCCNFVFFSPSFCSLAEPLTRVCQVLGSRILLPCKQTEDYTTWLALLCAELENGASFLDTPGWSASLRTGFMADPRAGASVTGSKGSRPGSLIKTGFVSLQRMELANSLLFAATPASQQWDQLSFEREDQDKVQRRCLLTVKFRNATSGETRVFSAARPLRTLSFADSGSHQHHQLQPQQPQQQQHQKGGAPARRLVYHLQDQLDSVHLFCVVDRWRRMLLFTDRPT